MSTQPQDISNIVQVPNDNLLTTRRPAVRRRGQPVVNQPKSPNQPGTGRRVRAAQSQRERQLCDLINGMACYVSVLTPEGAIVHVNDAMLKIVELSLDDIAGYDFADSCGWFNSENVQAQVQQAIASAAEGNITRFDTEMRISETRLIALDLSITPLRNGSGRVTHLLASAIDITERKRAEEQLERLAPAVEQTADGVMITDTEGKIVYVNPAFEKTSGYTREEAIGKTPQFLNSGKQEAAFYQHLWATIIGGHVWKGRVINRNKSGAFYEEELTISPVRDSSGNISNYVGLMRDITKVTALENQLQQAQKMEAVGRLAGGVAHDFNNLLTAIIGYTQMLMQRLEPNSLASQEAAEVIKAGERAAALTGQLLLFSRQKITERKPIDLNGTIGGLMKMLRRIIGEDIEVRVLPGAGVPQVLADAAQMEQVIMNLAVNARDAMPGGGTLTIETRMVGLDSAYCQTIVGARPGQYVQLSISDTGIGMDAETQQHIFEPFFTTKELGQGTGLGLSVVYGILQKHEGFVHVYSQPGQGTTFKVYVPVHEGGLEIELPSVEAPVRGGSETILVVEDEEVLRKIANSVLSGLGYKVILARDGMEALEICNGHQGELDLILMDLVMPRMGGCEAYQGIKAMNVSAPVVFMTGYSSETPQSAFIRQRALELIQKPYSPNHLARKVREVLDAQHHV